MNLAVSFVLVRALFDVEWRVWRGDGLHGHECVDDPCATVEGRRVDLGASYAALPSARERRKNLEKAQRSAKTLQLTEWLK